MATQDQLNLDMQLVCLMKQNQMLNQQNAMLRDLIDRVDSVGDLVWRMDRRYSVAMPPIDQTRTHKRTAKKRNPARRTAISRKRQGK